jgi:mannose-1-phosphate guanylyltransferase
VIVSGVSLVTINDKDTLVKANESTYIPIGANHRLSNPGKVDVILIEAQVGDYLQEDDIVRLDDDYERL